MAVKFSNNAATTLAANVTNSATTITVADGSVFPTLAGTDFTFITLEDVDSNREIVKLTAVSSNTLTIVRAQDGSSARAYSTNDKVELRLTAALLNAAVDSGAADLRVNSFTGDGSTVAYSLSSSPDLSNTLAYIDGIYQVKAAYSISGQVLTFTAAPDSGALIEITAATVAPIQESTDFLINNFTGNNSTTAFSLSSTPTSENQCSVFISGVYQSKANFSVSGSTLTFSTAPPNGSAIEVMVARTVVFSAGTPDDNTVSTVKIQDDAVTSAKVDGTVATVAGTETLTNKTLTAPDINTPDIDGGTIDGAVIGGATPAAISGTTGTFSSTVRAVGTTLTSASSATLAFTGTTSRLESRGADVSTRGAIQLMQATSNGSNEIVALGIDAAGAATFNSTINSGASNVVGIDGTPADVNAAELGKGYLNLSRDDVANRKMIQFGSNGALLGSIFSGHNGTQLGIGCSTTGITFNPNTRSMMPADPTSTGPQLDATLDIGHASVRWKDLYLSGGVVFGPASASNVSSQTLDSYEEGTWTPAGANFTVGTINSARYTKIGNQVTVVFYFQASSGNNSPASITGLPFTAINLGFSTGSINLHPSNPTVNNIQTRVVSNSTLVAILTAYDATVPATSVDSGHIIGTVTYFTDS